MVLELLDTLGEAIGFQHPIGVHLLIVCDYEGFRFLESLKVFNYPTPERLVIDVERLHCYLFHIIRV